MDAVNLHCFEFLAVYGLFMVGKIFYLREFLKTHLAITIGGKIHKPSSKKIFYIPQRMN